MCRIPGWAAPEVLEEDGRAGLWFGSLTRDSSGDLSVPLRASLPTVRTSSSLQPLPPGRDPRRSPGSRVVASSTSAATRGPPRPRQGCPSDLRPTPHRHGPLTSPRTEARPSRGSLSSTSSRRRGPGSPWRRRRRERVRARAGGTGRSTGATWTRPARPRGKPGVGWGARVRGSRTGSDAAEVAGAERSTRRAEDRNRRGSRLGWALGWRL